jgi:methionyl-tRNA formyltransferase
MAVENTAILLAGDGHGAIAVFQGLVKGGFRPDVCTRDPDLMQLADREGARSVSRLTEWEQIASGVVIMAGYKPIVPAEVILGCRILNIHYSLLPAYRGVHSTVWAMINGEPEVGLTLHEADALVDNGPVIWQERVRVLDHTSWELMLQMDSIAENGIAKALSEYLTGARIPYEQDFGAATFVGRRNKEDCRVSWAWDAVYFSRVLKALVPPYPRAFFSYEGTEYDIVDAEVVHRYYTEIPGRIVYRDHESVWIKLVDGLLRLRLVEAAGQTSRAVDVFTKVGYRLQRN